MEMILTILNVAGGIVAGVFSVMCFELLRVLAGRKVDATVATLRARLADVEALRRGDLRSAGCTCQRWPTHQANDCPLHGEETGCIHCGTMGWGSDHDEDCPFNPVRRFDPDEVSDLPVEIAVPAVTSREQAERLARHLDPCRVPPAGWECTREPGHDGPCAAVPSVIREHLGDPPYSGEERAVDRAYADAGIMPVGEYVAKHGGRPG